MSVPEARQQRPPAAQAEQEEWPTDPNSYEFIGKIGQGAFATVWGAKTTTTAQDDRDCAVKVLNLDHVDTNLDEIRREVQAMRLSSHENILTCNAAFVSDVNLWLVTPLMRKGSSLHALMAARKVLHEQKQKPHMEEHIMYILHETLLGLQYIHDNGQIHRDIKAGNILLDGNGDVRIADFGVSGWLVQGGSQQEKAKTFVGTPCWMAPEVMEQVHGYDYKADIWSLGITALELAKGYAPYAKYPPMKVLILTIQEDPPSLDSYDEEGDDDDDDLLVVDEEYSKAFRNLVGTCLQKNFSRRPTCQELLQSKQMSVMNDAKSRAASRERIKAQVCDLVQDVGAARGGGAGGDDGTSSSSRRMPGNTPIFLAEEKDRPAGTTWVFADGSQVLSATDDNNNADTVDDVMAELDEFGKQTGGENYDRTAAARSSSENVVDKNDDEDSSGHDDLNKFMDEFEQNTAGEDFRHPAKQKHSHL